MRWWLVSLLIESGDFCLARLSNGPSELEVMFYADLQHRRAVLRRLDIQGAGPNVLGWMALRELAQDVMEVLDVDELRIEGAARTSGASPGRRPTPLVFRRVGHVGA
jgi:hypothetical protein